MRLNGNFTVEAAVIFPLLTLMVVMVIKWDFYLHDVLLADTCKIMGGLRALEEEAFYYDMNIERIDPKRVAESPLIGRNTVARSPLITARVVDYFGKNKLGNEVQLSTTPYTDVIACRSNAEIVRAGGRAVQIIGG